MVAAVVGLPMVLRDDGTAKGLTQILLTYTLTAVSVLLGMATLWLSCGTLARDVEECQIQMVTVKPIARWQIWLGKWLGILGMNALLLALSGVSIFVLLGWRSAHLPAAEQKVLRDEIFVARASLKERPPDLRAQIDKLVKQAMNDPRAAEYGEGEVRRQIASAVVASNTVVPPRFWRRWAIDVHTLPQKTQDEPFELRIKFHAADPNPEATYATVWRVGPETSSRAKMLEQTLPPDSFQEFELPAKMVDEKGRLFIDMLNASDSALMFPLEDGFELLYYESSFAVNFVRGIAIIFCWLALLSAIGLATASQLGFPVAAFTSMAILILGLSSGTLKTVVEQNSVVGWDTATSSYKHTPLDYLVVPIFNGALKIINLVEGFSPIDYLSTGRSITWGMLGLAVTQIVVLLGGVFVVAGMLLFSRRELATAQGNT